MSSHRYAAVMKKADPNFVLDRTRINWLLGYPVVLDDEFNGVEFRPARSASVTMSQYKKLRRIVNATV